MMRSNLIPVLSGIVLASAVAVGTGCSNDTLSSGTQSLNLTYKPSPSGAGRFNKAAFVINKIQALPVDPEQAEIFGTERLLFGFNPFPVNLTLTTEVPLSAAQTVIALSAGTYRVTLIEFEPLALVDNVVSPNPTSCIEGVDIINAQSSPQVPQVFPFEYPPPGISPPGLTFTIQPGQTSLSVVVNVPGLIAGYEAAFAPGCVYVACPGCPVDPVPTLTTFDAASFRNALLNNIKIQ